MSIALTPLDGRYYSRVSGLIPYLSDYGLIQHRVMIEVRWLRHIAGIANKTIDTAINQKLDLLVKNFNEQDADAIRQIENSTNHDVKAVELWIAQKLEMFGATEFSPLVHFGRTSADINNLAYALMLKGARQSVIVPELERIYESLNGQAQSCAKYPMLARTHGQPATPTTMGKELAVFAARIKRQIDNIQNVAILGKCNGATGTFAADLAAFPDVNWPAETEKFVSELGLEYNLLTTQIEPHDWIARLNNELALASTICIDLSRDIWQYISIGYLVQKTESSEVGSSTMPHKVNPIDFENAEANFGVANALLNHLSSKLPISRLQRDLSDSSAMRSLSEAYGHMLVALSSLSKGLSKISADQAKMKSDLQNEWSVLTESIQTVMRKNGIADAYDQMKDLSRGKSIDQQQLRKFIERLDIDATDKKRLLKLTPLTYIGLAQDLVKS